ncbi:hypothetical protein BVX94_03505 [bacterium B17]|nr:hypothetical protein BVX94_03505 [bacterium B17]
MNTEVPEVLTIIAGKGAYPRLLAESARKQGVKKLFAVAFKKETDKRIEGVVDETRWLYVGQMQKFVDALQQSGAKYAVMAGAITPTNLFRVRMDSKMLEILKKLPIKNAETIFGAIGDELKEINMELLPASSFMESHMPNEGILTNDNLTEQQKKDIKLGLKAATTTSDLDIGQTVVIKDGTVLAVEAFDGTDETITRAGRLGGAGAVVVKVAKSGHDMRFDIPVIGMNTMKLLKKIKASVLALEAGKAILLERDEIIREANGIGMTIIVTEPRGKDIA